MKQLNWVRIWRIAIGISFLGSYFFYSDSIFVLGAGGILLAQGILNVGCPPFMGNTSCKSPQKPLELNQEDLSAVEYEVIS
ncbi:MAG: hypothetical protein ACO388_08865 [Saprospiraceae bacterium]|jgi:hypothetical protein